MAILKFQPKPNGIDLKNADYSAMLSVWGNANALGGYAIFYGQTIALKCDRERNPRFAEGPYEALGIIGAEFKKLEHAVERDESKFRQIEQAKELVAVLLRFINGEHEREPA